MPNRNNISIADILELSVQERIRLVKLIWDSVAAVPKAVKVSPELKAELEARLAEFEANPGDGYSWEQVKASLKNGAWRSALNFPAERCVKSAKHTRATNYIAPALAMNSSLQ